VWSDEEEKYVAISPEYRLTSGSGPSHAEAMQELFVAIAIADAVQEATGLTLDDAIEEEEDEEEEDEEEEEEEVEVEEEPELVVKVVEAAPKKVRKPRVKKAPKVEEVVQPPLEIAAQAEDFTKRLKAENNIVDIMIAEDFGQEN
jgi:hypothetical protein